jgi:hypothetical protein
MAGNPPGATAVDHIKRGAPDVKCDLEISAPQACADSWDWDQAVYLPTELLGLGAEAQGESCIVCICPFSANLSCLNHLFVVRRRTREVCVRPGVGLFSKLMVTTQQDNQRPARLDPKTLPPE